MPAYSKKNKTAAPKPKDFDIKSGGILSNKDILNLIKRGELAIEPFSEDQLQQAGVDLSISDEWHFIKEDLNTPVDIQEFSIEKHTYKLKSDKIVLEPGKMCLALTRERVKMPNYLAGIMEGRSRFARAGLTVHITSSIIQPGSQNRQILEMVNLGPKPLLIRAGTRLMHVFFLRLTSPTTRPYINHSTLPNI